MKQWLAERGHNRRYGVRPLTRTIRETIKKPLVEELLFGRLVRGGAVKATMRDGKLDFELAGAALPAWQLARYRKSACGAGLRIAGRKTGADRAGGADDQNTVGLWV